MNVQEHTLLTTLLLNLDQAAAPLTPQAKDAEADRLIRQAFNDRPDIAYLLVQRHLLLEQAMQQAQARIAELERAPQVSEQAGARSFLGQTPPGGTTNVYGQPVQASGAVPPVSSPPIAPTQSPAMNAAAAKGVAGGSFLGTAAATATGVLGGALLFQGIEHLMGGGQSWAGTPNPVEITNITENVDGADAGAPTSEMTDAGWSSVAPDRETNPGLESGFDDPGANPVDPQYASLDAGSDDTGGGLFDGLFGDGGDDGWV